jgi:hypothetical protein
MLVGMDIDSHDSAQGHELIVIGNSQQPVRAEVAHITNGGDSEWKESVGPGPQLLVGSMQREEVQIEDITGKQYSSGEDIEPEVGTSSTLVKRKGKQPIAWCPHKLPDATIFLPHIPEGV